MKIIEMPISKIVPYANNPRDNDGAVDAVAASIQEFNVLTAAKMNYISHYGQLLKIKRQDLVVIDQLDAMKEDKKTIYGSGILISERAAAERAAAERAAAERAAAERAAAERENIWQLSDREKEIIAGLGRE